MLPEDLNKFGMIPEFVGRIPVICSLDELTEDDLVHILTDPKNALVKQYVRMFEFENSELVFTPEALRAIAHEAVEHGTGARGLRAICERVLQDVMFDLPEHAGPTRVVIRPSDIEGETKPKSSRRPARLSSPNKCHGLAARAAGLFQYSALQANKLGAESGRAFQEL